MANSKKYINVEIHIKSQRPRVEVEKSVSMFGEEATEDIYHVYVSALPNKGEANSELIKLLSEYFDLAKSQINIIKGYTSRTKLVEIER